MVEIIILVFVIKAVFVILLHWSFQEKICEESASFDLSSLDLATAIEETTKLAERVAELSSLETEFSQVEDSPIGNYSVYQRVGLSFCCY